MIEVSTKIKFSEGYRDFLQKQIYEKYILKVMNASEVFDGKFMQNDIGLDRQSDYYDLVNKRYLDVKIIFGEKLIGSFSRKQYEEFAAELMKQMSVDIGKDINEITNCELYKNIENILINKIDNNEDCILFCPVPSEPDFRGSFVFGMGIDNVQMVYNLLRDKYNEILRDKRVYYVTFTFDNLVSIKELSGDNWTHKDYLTMENVDEFVVNCRENETFVCDDD